MIQPAYESKHIRETSLPFLYLALSIFPLLGIASLVFVVYALYVLIAARVPFYWFLAFSYMFITPFLLLHIGWYFIETILAQYRFQDNGLYVKYPLSKGRLIPWNAFQEVCICYGGLNSRPHNAAPVICCVKKGERRNGYGRWKTNHIFHYKHVITIPYSPELHEGIKEKCPYKVVDLRNTLNYRLDL